MQFDILALLKIQYNVICFNSFFFYIHIYLMAILNHALGIFPLLYFIYMHYIVYVYILYVYTQFIIYVL